MTAEAATSSPCIHSGRLVKGKKDHVALDSVPPTGESARSANQASLDGVPHYCGEYTCPGCERSVPNCFGAYDELLELCDDCACEVWRARVAHGGEAGEDNPYAVGAGR